MIANYHTHTRLCRHATGEMREYVEEAIQRGLKILGFSDHSPYVFPKEWEYYSTYRMFPEDTEHYIRTLRDLKREYARDIDIKIGFEAEYYPDLFSDFLDFIRPFDVDYLIMGQHFIGNEFGGKYNGWDTEEEDHLVTYVSQVLAGLDTGRFSYLAHPDLINFQGDEAILRREFARLAQGLAARGIPAEINLLGIRTRRHYPNRIFWEEAAKVGGIAAILGCDAHEPETVLDFASEAVAVEQLRALSIPLLETLPLKKPF
jgi:histidinol-phosphatase (PHP family)